MLRIFVLLAALPLAAVAQTRHEHHQHSKPAAVAPDKTAPAKPARADTGATLSRYQRFTPDEPLKDWRAVNDTVRSIGGWQVYGLEAARAIEAEKKAAGAKP